MGKNIKDQPLKERQVNEQTLTLQGDARRVHRKGLTHVEGRGVIFSEG